jgi:hypothetical protein
VGRDKNVVTSMKKIYGNMKTMSQIFPRVDEIINPWNLLLNPQLERKHLPKCQCFCPQPGTHSLLAILQWSSGQPPVSWDLGLHDLLSPLADLGPAASLGGSSCTGCRALMGLNSTLRKSKITSVDKKTKAL